MIGQLHTMQLIFWKPHDRRRLEAFVDHLRGEIIHLAPNEDLGSQLISWKGGKVGIKLINNFCHKRINVMDHLVKLIVLNDIK